VLSSLSEKHVDYSGDDHDLRNDPAPRLDTSKFSHLMEEKTQAAASEMKLPLGDTTTTEGTLSTPIIAFLFHHTNLVLTLTCMIFTEVVVATEGETLLNITEMIEELIQSEGLKVPKTSARAIPMGTTSVAGSLLSMETCRRTCRLQPLNLVRYKNLILFL